MKENTWAKNLLTYTPEILSIFQRIISNVFGRQRNYTEYISNRVTCKKKKHKEKMSHGKKKEKTQRKNVSCNTVCNSKFDYEQSRLNHAEQLRNINDNHRENLCLLISVP